jgi:hypothetical protein
VRARRNTTAALAATAALGCASLLVAVPGAGGAQSERRDEGATRAPAVVRVADCSRGPLPSDRSVEFRGAMRDLPGSERMGMRFRLQERLAGGRYVTVDAPGLGVWRDSHLGVARFVHRQRVLELATAATYRARVDFRWYREDGSVLQRAARRSGGCRQRGRLPDLRVTHVGARRIDGVPGVRYVVYVFNAGRGGAEASTVALDLDGTSLGAAEVGPVPPGRHRRVFVAGPDCLANLRVEVDPEDALRESGERNNVRAGRCPTVR